MAQVEPMDIDAIESDFDNKENAFHHNNVSSRTPCTEKGYEELDVSELNMKLRYSMTPASSPMTKSLTGPCLDNRNNNSEDYLNNTVGAESGNLTRSLNSSFNKTEGLLKSKVLPLQTLSTDLFVDSNSNSSIRRLLDPADSIGAIISSANNIDDNLSVPSSCSSVPDTPEATTPTKEIPKPEGSPIMRGLKSVLSMFRPSQSPIPPADEKSTKQEILNPFESVVPSISTPGVIQSDGLSSKRSSPLKESLVFNDDLERELQWKDQTTIILKGERVPLQKLRSNNVVTEISPVAEPVNTTVEYMDISGNESALADNTMSNIMQHEQSIKNNFIVAVESDNEFLDCETTFSKNESDGTDCKEFVVGKEIIVTGDEMVDSSVKAEISQEIKSEKKNTLNNTGCELGDITVCAEQASVSFTDSTIKTDRNDTNIIEVIHNLNSEKQYCSKMTDNHTAVETQNVDLQNQSRVNKKLQLHDKNITNIAVSLDKDSIKDDVIKHGATETKSCSTLIMGNDIITSENVEDMGINTISTNVMLSQEVKTNIDNLSDICTKVLNSIENIKESCDVSHTTDTKENICAVDNVAVTVTDMNIFNYSTFDNGAKNTEFISSVPNTEEPIQTHHLAGTQILEVESDTDLLDSNKDSIVNTSSMVIKSLNESHRSSNVKSNLDEDCQIPEDLIPLTKLTKDEDNMPLKEISQSDLVAELNVPNIDIETDLREINITERFCHGNVEVIETNDESNSSEITLKDTVEFRNYDATKTSYFPSNTFSVLNNVSSEIPELPVKNDVIVINSEIPLPDENDIEQNILSSDVMYKIDSNTQNTMNTTFKNCEESSVVSVGNELLTVCTEYGNTSTRSNSSEENKETFIIDEDRFKVTQNMLPVEEDLKLTQICPYQSSNIHMTDDKASNETSITRDKVISELQITHYNSLPKENVSEKISMIEGIYKDVQQHVPESQSSKDICLDDDKSTVYKINVEKGPSNTEESSSITKVELVKAVKPGNINDLKMSEKTNQVKMDDDKQQNFTPEKEVGEVDEEIITSANNSPYVSVTDLVIDVEQMLTDPLEEIVNPFATNTKLSSSPAISPKIVSKGYNFNFDEMDDPFATKIKIRMSPTPDAANESFGTSTKEIPEVPKKINKRRKWQLEKKRPIQKKNINMTYTGKSTNKESTSVQRMDLAVSTSNNMLLDNISTTSVKDNMSENKPDNFVNTVSQNDKTYQKVDDSSEFVTTDASQSNPFVEKEETQNNSEETKCLEKTLVISTEKSSSSSEQYFSLGTSSGESSGLMNRSKNVFNLPEIDDMNFNPFSTKSKMRMSPPPTDRTITLQCTGDVTNSSFDKQQPSDLNDITTIKDSDLNFNKITTEHSLHNTSNATCSSKNTNDEEGTARETLTEDEDTVEGPFLETEDFTDTEKLNDVEVDTGMINFDEEAKQDKNENLESGELFIDADAFEFLLNQNKSTTVLDSGKESLFLKFDPLFAKRVSSDGILAALHKVQKRQSTPKKVTPMQKDFASIENPVAGSSYDNENSGPIEEYNEDLSSTVTKPMMVVNPAISSIFTQKKSATPKLNRRSLTFTSPAMAVIDRLLSLNGNSSNSDYDPSMPQVGRERTETDLAITQLRELLAEKNIDVHHLRSESKELKARLAALELQVSGLENESAERLAKINKLNECLSEKTKLNKCMATVVEEYERTIATLIAETEQNKKRNAEERMRLIKERDEQTKHLTNMEVSFSDLHSKYEKSKQIILKCKAKEDICRKSIQEFQENLTKMQNNYELLKQHATSKLNHANQELEKMNRAHEAEVLKMNALMKRKELHITSLEESLAQKTKANDELTAICDELINKVG